MKKTLKLITSLLAVLSCGSLASCEIFTENSGGSNPGKNEMTIEKAFDDSGMYLFNVLDGVQKGSSQKVKDVPVTIEELTSATPIITNLAFNGTLRITDFVAKEEVYIDTISITVNSTFDFNAQSFTYCAKNYKKDHFEYVEWNRNVVANVATTLTYTFPEAQLVRKDKTFTFGFTIRDDEGNSINFGHFTTQEDLDTKHMSLYNLKMTFKEDK